MSDKTRTTIELYHEFHGEHRDGGVPLVLIHGGGSTIETSFGAIIPWLARTRLVIAVELQGHGRTPSPGRPFTFEHSADDVAALLRRLDIPLVDLFGFSNGGNVALRMAMRYPPLVRRQIVASAFYRRDGLVDGFWEGFDDATIADMPALYLDADRALNPDPVHQQELFDLDTGLMRGFTDWAAEELAAVTAPTLLVAGDRDVVRPDHVVAMARLIPAARLLVLPAVHGDFIGEALAAGGDHTAMELTLPWLLRFLEEAG